MEQNILSKQTAVLPQTVPDRTEDTGERAGGHSRKKLNLTGQRYGKLTALAPAENIGARTAWLCRCDCGREIVVKTVHLRSGHKMSCGCQDGSGGSKTALGLTYVDGTCVEMLAARTVRRNNTSGVPGVDWLTKKQRWRASICFKGRRRYLGSYKKFEDAVKARKQAEEQLFDAFLDAYSGGAPQSEQKDADEVCPPRTRDYSGQRLDLTGRRFGQLTVLAPAENIGAMTAWRCRCDCGKELAVMTAHLRSGQTSCGCKQKWTFVDGTFVELLRSKTLRRSNTSGVTGVEWVPASNKWKAVISFKGRRYYLGCYENFEDAVRAWKRGEEEYHDKFLEEFAEENMEESS